MTPGKMKGPRSKGSNGPRRKPIARVTDQLSKMATTKMPPLKGDIEERYQQKG
jgi:hypothetical protein